MTIKSHTKPIIRTERGLTIAGTRITLYDVMDYIEAKWPRKLIRDWYNLTDEQIDAALNYIAEHYTEVKAEYEQVVREAAENRQYWEERNRQHIAELGELPLDPTRERLRAKFRIWQAQHGAIGCDS